MHRLVALNKMRQRGMHSRYDDEASWALDNVPFVGVTSKRGEIVALTQSYLITTKNLPAFLAAIQSAKAPERFTTKFLNQLEFTSSNDRLYLGVLKGLGFIDEAGVPTKRYYAFLDQSESGKVLAEAIREAYEDLFAVNKKAQDLSLDDVKNKLKALTQGQKSENVTNLMAGTFKALASQADWKASEAIQTIAAAAGASTSASTASAAGNSATGSAPFPHAQPSSFDKKFQLRYDIHIHLPESRDPAVFDAIFEAMRKHLSA